MDGYAAVAVAEPGVGIVVFTGVTLVFLILVLIMLLIKAQGMLFDKIEQHKNKMSPKSEPTDFLKQPQPTPTQEQEIAPEIVAVIAAAVAAMEGNYRICDIKECKPKPVSQPVNAWAQAGRATLTTPFRR